MSNWDLVEGVWAVGCRRVERMRRVVVEDEGGYAGAGGAVRVALSCSESAAQRVNDVVSLDGVPKERVMAAAVERDCWRLSRAERGGCWRV